MTARPRMRYYTLANIGALVAMAVAVFNLITFREVWILVAAAIALVALTAYAVSQKRRMQRQSQRS